MRVAALEDLMGAHHAPAHVARHARRGAESSPVVGRLGRLAGRGALTASAALALAGASGGVALAHDADGDGPRGVLAGNDVSLLCGILTDCSSGADTSRYAEESDDDRDDRDGSERDDAGSRSATDTVLDGADDADRTSRADRFDVDRTVDDARGVGSGAGSDVPRSSTSASSTAPTSGAPEDPAIDTPPPPGQIRTIDLPG